MLPPRETKGLPGAFWETETGTTLEDRSNTKTVYRRPPGYPEV